ncbi:fungal hydrophobin-domain-containing protein [Amylostereum chailletii]|nr:fungal hydrophobin-domain-containing protein [Amylostereum chailletii]
MFSKLTLSAVVLAFAGTAAAGGSPPVTTTVTVTAPAPTGTEPASQCDTAPVQCCDSVGTAGSSVVAPILSNLGIIVQDSDVPVGITCSPLSIIGVGGNDCSANAVCCENNDFNGLVAIGCVPVNLNL